MSQIQSYAETNVGLQRDNNEDTFLECPEQNIWIVCDGMGGHASGEVASSIACQVIRDTYKKGSSLNDAIQASHHAVLQAAHDGLGGQGMGSTVVAAATHGYHYEIAWVGDSRAYLCTKDKIEQLTTDHSYVQMLFESGLIAAEEMANHPDRNIITQCLGSTELEDVKIDLVCGEWHDKDTLLLCSDGLTDLATDDEILQVINSAGNLQEAGTHLINLSLSRGGKDNITVALINKDNNVIRNIMNQLTGKLNSTRNLINKLLSSFRSRP